MSETTKLHAVPEDQVEDDRPTAEDVLENAMLGYYSLAIKYQPKGKTPDDYRFEKYLSISASIAMRLFEKENTR